MRVTDFCTDFADYSSVSITLLFGSDVVTYDKLVPLILVQTNDYFSGIFHQTEVRARVFQK